jgi:hypothetical protein
MNLWDGRSVRLVFTESGRSALAAYLGSYEAADVVVQQSDSFGIWTEYGLPQGNQLRLLLIRWEFIQTAEQYVFLDDPLPEAEEKHFGFRLIKQDS